MLQKITILFAFMVYSGNAIGDLWPPCYGPGEICCDSCTQIPNGAWSAWTDYTACTMTCGLRGNKVQRRTCVSWSFGCPCKGAYSRLVPCAVTPCPKAPQCKAPYTLYTSTKTKQKLCGNVTRDDDFVYAACNMAGDGYLTLNCSPCPTGGVWSAWANNSTCSATCGLCGKVNQTRYCVSSDWGCPCTGPTTQTYACPKKPCPTGTKCCGGTVVVKNLVTNTNQCGLQLAPDQVLHPVDCITTPSTTTPTTPPPTCNSACSQNLEIFKVPADNGVLSFTYGSDLFQQGCLIGEYKCDFSPATTTIYVWFVLQNGTTTFNINDNFGKPPLQTRSSSGSFKCAITETSSVWAVRVSNVYYPIKYIRCGSTRPSGFWG